MDKLDDILGYDLNGMDDEAEFKTHSIEEIIKDIDYNIKIKFLGTGSAFVIPERDNNYHSNILIEIPRVSNDYDASDLKLTPIGQSFKIFRMLFDAGTTLPSSLYRYDLDVDDINAVFISHLHGDHCGGLEYLGFKSYFNPSRTKENQITLFTNKRIEKQLWNEVLKGTMSAINGNTLELKDYFHSYPINPKSVFKFGFMEFTPIKVEHVVSDLEEIPAYGLKFIAGQTDIYGKKKENPIETKILITGDTSFNFWHMMGGYEWADIIFHDCEFKEYDNSVHAQYRFLKDLPKEYKKKIWLYHYSELDFSNYGVNSREEMNDFVRSDGFAGLVLPGQEFKF